MEGKIYLIVTKCCHTDVEVVISRCCHGRGRGEGRVERRRDRVELQ